MLRDGRPIGAIMVGRLEVRPFADVQIALLQTFADQAVIAIENVRLFKELEARNRELTETLEQQTATGEILQVISSSPTDTQPVFDAIVRSAGRFGDAAVAMLLRLEGRMIVLEALEGMSETEMEIHRRSGTREVAPDSVGGRVVLTRGIVQITDVKEDPEYAVVGPLTLGYRTALAVPLLREGAAIGAIVLWRREVRPFADKQIAARPDLRGPGGDRDRERAPLPGAPGTEPRADRVARAADGHRRDSPGHERLAHRRPARSRCCRRECDTAM